MSRQKIQVGFEGKLEELEVSVPDGEPQPWDAASELQIVGRPLPRIDAVAKVTGRARYTQDVKPPGLLYARVLRSRLPSARIAALDVEPARAVPGVKAVWAEKVGKRVFFAGQEVAAVAATTVAAAEEALGRVVVRYEEQPFVVDATRARRGDAPLVFPPREKSSTPEPDDDDLPGAKTKHDANVRTTIASEPRNADMDKAFREAEVIVEGTFRTQVQTHAALEPHGAVAWWQGDQLTVWSSTQATFGVRDQVAQALRISKDRVKVLCEYMGGGFGAKFNAGPHTIIAARLAKDAAAPVKLMLTRHEEHLCTGNRPDSVQWLKLGAKRDGTLVALHLKSYGTPGVGTGAATGGPARALYAVKAWKTEESDVFTNAGAAQPFRAPGHPQGCFALEQAIDDLAEKLGMDPVELRRKNLTNPLQVAELDKITGPSNAPSLWATRKKAGAATGRIRRGVGLACGVWYKIVNRGTQVEIDIHNDGRIEVKNGAQDIGTGTRTLMAMVAAEELSLPLSAITVQLGDTSWPHGPGSGGSTTATSIAPAVRAAAYQAKRKIFEVAARIMKASPSELQMKDGLISAKKDLAGGLTFAQAAARIPGEKITVVASRADDFEGRFERHGGVQIAEVEVDTETGNVRVLRVSAIQDCGRVLNPLLATSQVNGGIIQGVSYALLENRAMDQATGRMVNTDLESYKILTANDCPEIRTEFFAVSPGWNNTGAIGLGEPPTVPTAGAIANAVYNAIGVRMRELPITPDRVLAALGKSKLALAEAITWDDPKGGAR